MATDTFERALERLICTVGRVLYDREFCVGPRFCDIYRDDQMSGPSGGRATPAATVSRTHGPCTSGSGLKNH